MTEFPKTDQGNNQINYTKDQLTQALERLRLRDLNQNDLDSAIESTESGLRALKNVKSEIDEEAENDE